MEYLFTASYNGMEARLVFQSFGICMQARKVLSARGVQCGEVTPHIGSLHRSASELEAATKFVAFALA
jgi:hypothetical protein